MKYDKNVGKFFIDASLFKDVKYQSNFGKQKGGRPVKLKSLFIEQDNTKYDYDCFFNSWKTKEILKWVISQCKTKKAAL